MPYEELVKRLRYCAISDNQCLECKYHGGSPDGSKMCLDVLMEDAADAIEERDRYALTLQHEMMAEAESHMAQVERLNKQIEELQKLVAYWQAQLTKSMCGETLAELERPRWIPVAEALPESVDDDVLVTDGEGCAVGYWRPDAQAWDSTDFGWLENRSEPPCGIHTVTHWMSLPPLPEPPKEET